MEYNKEIIKSAIVKKHNALTDGHIPKPPKQVLPDRLLNALFWKFENEGGTYKITMAELRNLLGLKSSKDDHRIIEAISILQAPIFLRNFEYKGREIEWTSAPFLNDATKYKDGQNVVEITINPKVVAALKQKYGYTPLEIDICNRFRTKYGLKLYEMFRRYETLPNHEEKGVGTVAKSMDDLNKMFGTRYKTQSEMKRGIDRGLKEIEKHAGVQVTAFWDRFKKKFVFSWSRTKQMQNKDSNDYLSDLKTFIKYMRKHFVNKEIWAGNNMILSISEKGRIYDQKSLKEYNKNDSLTVWKKWYELAKEDKLLCLKQGTLF